MARYALESFLQSAILALGDCDSALVRAAAHGLGGIGSRAAAKILVNAKPGAATKAKAYGGIRQPSTKRWIAVSADALLPFVR